MNQEQDDSVATYLGLQGFEVVAVKREQPPRRGPVKGVKVERREGRHECPDCGRRHATALFAETTPIRLRDCSIGDQETSLEVWPARIACCGGTRVERLPFAMPGYRMTYRFFERIAALCTRLPVQSVAAMGNHSWATIARIDGRAIELALGARSAALDGLRWLGVDEVSRTGGRVYFTIVTNRETGRVIWIGEGKGRKGLLSFLRALGPKRRRKIRGVVSDLGYQRIIAKRLQMRGILRYPWKYVGVMRRRVQEWVLAVFDAQLPEFRTVARRITDPLDAVIAGDEHDVPLGLVESRNSQIAALRFQARGYRDPEYFKLKIFQRCGLVNNPWARIVL